MKKINFVLIIFALIFFVIEGCKFKKNVTARKEHIVFEQLGNNFLLRKDFDSLGNLVSKKYFNQDTIAKGEEIEYHSNGSIYKWKWFDTLNKYAYCAIYYDTNGKFLSYRGTPFISGGKYNEKTYVQLINPPAVNFFVGYREIYKGKILKQQAYEPALTDSTSWVMLSEYKYEKKHSYFIYFYFVDSFNKIIDSASRELLP
jgi:hypothetical protein